MKLIKPSFEIWQQPSGLEGVYKQIEHVGRVCYRSEDKITEDSAKPFVDRMIKSGHGAMLEHGTVYLFIPLHCDKTDYHITKWYYSNPYSRVKIRNEHYCFDSNGYYITTNLRVLVENNLIEHLKFICEPTEYHEKRICVRFICDRGILAEFTRHRIFSFSAESTRYCNYSKDKFGGELSFIIPTWFKQENNKYFKKTNTLPVCSPDEHFGGCLPEFYFKTGDDPIMEGMQDWTPEDYFMFNCLVSEWNYNHLIEEGWQAQQAAEVLPQCIKGDMIITGFEDDWKHLLDLRYYGTTGAPHPMVKELAALMKEELEKLGFNY